MTMKHTGTANERILVDQYLRDLLMKLAKSHENKRTSIVNEIMREMQNKQDLVQSGFCKEVTYTMTRLVRGVASEKARLAFSLLLTQMFRTFPDLSIESVQEKMKTLLQVQKTDTKGEQGNAVLGQIMVYLCLIQSGRLQQATGKEIKHMASELARLRHVRKPLELMCTEVFRELITQVSSQRFDKWVWPVLEPQLIGGWKNCTAEILLLLLTVCRHQSKTFDKSLIKEHWNSKIISKKNMKSIAKVLKSITHQSSLHPACTEVLETIASKPKTMNIFWKKVVDGSLLMSHSSPEKKYLVFQMVPHALSLCTSADQIHVVLSNRVSACLMGSLCDNRSVTHAAANSLASHLVKFVNNCSEASHQMAVLEALLSMPAETRIDHKKNRFFLNIMSAMNTEGAKALCQLLVSIILNQVEGDQQLHLKNIPVRWAAQTLCNVVTLPALSSDRKYQNKMLHFIFCYAFFVQNRSSPDVPHCAVRRILTDLERLTFTNGFFCVLGKLAKFNADESTSKNPDVYINTLDLLIDYAEVLLANQSVVSPVKEFSHKKHEEWNKIMKINREIKAMGIRFKDSRKDERFAFRLIFMHFGLHLFMKGFPNDMLQDLYTCYQRAFEQEDKPVSTEGEPEWMHVLMELLLSMLSENRNWVRTFVTIVFRMLCRHVTSASVQSIIDVLNDDKSEEGPLDFDDDEEEEDEEDNEEEKEENSDEEAKVDSDDDEEESDDGMDEGLRTDVAKALGHAAAPSDEEGSSELSDLSDSEMSRYDAALATVFRNSGSGKKKQAEEKDRALQLKNFKLKCLDLVAILIQSRADPDILLQLVRPLLDLIDKSFKDKLLKVLGERAKVVLFMLCNRKKFSTDPRMNKDDMLALIKELFCFTTKAPIVTAIGSACLFVMRLLVGSSAASSSLTQQMPDKKHKKAVQTEQKTEHLQQLLEFIRDSIQECCSKNPSAKDLNVFMYVSSRQSTLLWPLAESLLEHVKNAEIRLYRRTQVCTMLTEIINKKTIQDIGYDVWHDFAKRLVPDVYQVLQTFCAKPLKPRMIRLLLTVIHKALVCSKTEHIAELIPSDLYKCAEEVKAKAPHCKDTKRACNDLLRLINNRMGASDKSAASQPQKQLGVTNLCTDVVSEASSNKKKRKLTDDDANAVTPVTNVSISSSKKKKKKKLSSQGDDPAEHLGEMNHTSIVEDTTVCSPSKKKKKSNTPHLEDELTENVPTPTAKKEPCSKKVDVSVSGDFDVQLSPSKKEQKMNVNEVVNTPKGKAQNANKTPDTAKNSSKKRKRRSTTEEDCSSKLS